MWTLKNKANTYNDCKFLERCLMKTHVLLGILQTTKQGTFSIIVKRQVLMERDYLWEEWPMLKGRHNFLGLHKRL